MIKEQLSLSACLFSALCVCVGCAGRSSAPTGAPDLAQPHMGISVVQHLHERHTNSVIFVLSGAGHFITDIDGHVVSKEMLINYIQYQAKRRKLSPIDIVARLPDTGLNNVGDFLRCIRFIEDAAIAARVAVPVVLVIAESGD